MKRENHQISIKYKNSSNKRHLSADGSLLLPSALRPRLLGIGVVIPIITIISLVNGFLPSNSVSAATSLNLTLPSEIKIANIQPNSGLQKSSPSNISITTTAPFGYTLSIKTKDGTALKHSSSSISSSISTII